jgi:hypothetical protein
MGVVPGDIATATHAGLGANYLDLTCSARVTAVDSVLVVLSNRGTSVAVVTAGVVRAAIVQYI